MSHNAVCFELVAFQIKNTALGFWGPKCELMAIDVRRTMKIAPYLLLAEGMRRNHWFVACKWHQKVMIIFINTKRVECSLDGGRCQTSAISKQAMLLLQWANRFGIYSSVFCGIECRQLMSIYEHLSPKTLKKKKNLLTSLQLMSKKIGVFYGIQEWTWLTTSFLDYWGQFNESKRARMVVYKQSVSRKILDDKLSLYIFTFSSSWSGANKMFSYVNLKNAFAWIKECSLGLRERGLIR